MLEEIREIPKRARECLRKNSAIRLPLNVPYIGMGSSYYAPLALKYSGSALFPEISSEYAYYLSQKKRPEAVLISQSGHSTETLWIRQAFDTYVALVNDPTSPLATANNCRKVIDLTAGEEKHSSTKTYLNTLITLYTGTGVDVAAAVEMLDSEMCRFDDWGQSAAQSILQALSKEPQRGLIVVGSGPNYATAQQAALVLTETIHLPVQALTASQYDHGPKEAAPNSIVLIINADGPVLERTRTLVEKIRDHGATVCEWDQGNIPERISPIHACIPFFFVAAYLSDLMGIKDTFCLGNKVTQTDGRWMFPETI